MATINNVAYDGGTIEARFNGSAFGLQEIGWDQKVDKKKVRAIGQQAARKRTKGSYEVSDSSVKLDTGEWNRMLAALPADDYSSYEFTIFVDYIHPDLGTQSVQLLECCIVGEKDSIKEGSDATMKELTISIMSVVTNGKTMYKRGGTKTPALANVGKF